MDVTLRKAAATDSGFCYRVREAAFREYAEKVRGWDEERERTTHQARFATQEFQIIQLQGRDVGILSAEAASDYLQVFQLFILPDHQDKGIGSFCMKNLIDQAAELHIPLRLQVIKGNDRALSFYERHGFQIEGETEHHIQLERQS